MRRLPSHESGGISIPKEFLPDHRLHCKQYTFAQSVTRSRSTKSSLQSQPVTSRSATQTILEDPDAIALRDRLHSTHDYSVLSDSDLLLLVSHLKEYVKFVGSTGDYEEARRQKSLLIEASDKLTHRTTDLKKSEAPRERYRERERTRQEKWQKEVDDFDAETDLKTDQLAAQQGGELKAFRDHWHGENTLRRYRKASSRLLQLWRIEKFMAKQTEFNHAEVVKAEATELSYREMQRAQAQADRDYHVELSQMKERHKKEMDAHLQNRQHWREVMLARHQLEKDQLERDLHAVEIKQAEPCRKREPFQATSSRPITAAKKYAVGPEISFEYPTFLPFPISPSDRVSGTESREEQAN
jgi:hypothetical protein